MNFEVENKDKIFLQIADLYQLTNHIILNQKSSTDSKMSSTYSQLTVEKCAVTKQILESKYANGVLANMAKERLAQTSVNEGAYQTMIKQRRFVKEYTKIATIGRGAFGEVRLVQDKKGKVSAMKILKKSEMLKKNQICKKKEKKKKNL